MKNFKLIILLLGLSLVGSVAAMDVDINAEHFEGPSTSGDHNPDEGLDGDDDHNSNLNNTNPSNPTSPIVSDGGFFDGDTGPADPSNLEDTASNGASSIGADADSFGSTAGEMDANLERGLGRPEENVRGFKHDPQLSDEDNAFLKRQQKTLNEIADLRHDTEKKTIESKMESGEITNESELNRAFEEYKNTNDSLGSASIDNELPESIKEGLRAQLETHNDYDWDDTVGTTFTQNKDGITTITTDRPTVDSPKTYRNLNGDRVDSEGDRIDDNFNLLDADGNQTGKQSPDYLGTSGGYGEVEPDGDDLDANGYRNVTGSGGSRENGALVNGSYALVEPDGDGNGTYTNVASAKPSGDFGRTLNPTYGGDARLRFSAPDESTGSMFEPIYSKPGGGFGDNASAGDFSGADNGSDVASDYGGTTDGEDQSQADVQSKQVDQQLKDVLRQGVVDRRGSVDTFKELLSNDSLTDEQREKVEKLSKDYEEYLKNRKKFSWFRKELKDNAFDITHRNFKQDNNGQSISSARRAADNGQPRMHRNQALNNMINARAENEINGHIATMRNPDSSPEERDIAYNSANDAVNNMRGGNSVQLGGDIEDAYEPYEPQSQAFSFDDGDDL